MRERGLKQVFAPRDVPQAVSLPMRERGLKPYKSASAHNMPLVAPHAGAWIETARKPGECPAQQVAPHAGAWIETLV